MYNINIYIIYFIANMTGHRIISFRTLVECNYLPKKKTVPTSVDIEYLQTNFLADKYFGHSTSGYVMKRRKIHFI